MQTDTDKGAAGSQGWGPAFLPLRLSLDIKASQRYSGNKEEKGVTADERLD